MGTTAAGLQGIGAVTGYGWGREQLWDGVLSGVPAHRLVAGHGATPDEKAWVAHVADGGDPADGPSRFHRAMRFAVREAVTDATARGWLAGSNVGLVSALVLGEQDLWRDFYLVKDGRTSVRDYLALMPSTPMSTVMQEFGFHGPAMGVSAMCASGNAALLTAKAWLDAGIVSDVVVVATDISCTPENVRHFRDLGVAITDEESLLACRPFQRGSRGFSLGEAAVAFVLSSRDGDPYAHLLGGAMSHDAFHATSIEPSLRQVRETFTSALSRTGTDRHDVAYLNAHGPGTAQCDRAEALMLEELLGPATGLYSVKPLAGHCQGAASAVEVAVAALGYERGIIPAPRQVADAHPRLLDGATERRPGLTVKSSLGMGGHNSVVVLAGD